MSIYKDKKVLITGASTGIGCALAEELNKRGAEVILTARSEDKLHALAEKIKASGGKAHVFPEDLSIQGSAEALYNKIKTQNLSVDILINNAGYGRWGELTSFERDDYAEMLQLNVVTLTDLCHLYLPDMVQQGGGGIINVGSMASLAPIPYASIYSSSKAYVCGRRDAGGGTTFLFNKRAGTTVPAGSVLLLPVALGKHNRADADIILNKREER